MPFRELIAPSGKWVSLRFPLSELFSIRKDCFTPRSFRKGLCLCKDPTVNTCFIICPAVYFISLPTTNNSGLLEKLNRQEGRNQERNQERKKEKIRKEINRDGKKL